MPRRQTSIGQPWILDVIAKYEAGTLKGRPVTAQVVQFVKMPGNTSDDPVDPAAVVHISDRKFYIRADITKEAKETMERGTDHFTLADIKNKIIILKNYSVCFMEDQNLEACEFYITVRHFSLFPMETDRVESTNCNLISSVRKMIKMRWQNYIAELAMKENSSDTSLTQLLNMANDDSFNVLKSLAEQCLDLLGDANQGTPNVITKWGAESWNNKDNTHNHTVSMNVLQIPPDEEATLAEIQEFQNDIEVACDLEEPVSDVQTFSQSSPLPYSTAFSPECEDMYYDVPETLSDNPWNELQSLCVSLSSGSASQTKESSPVVQHSGEEERALDPDSSTPELLLPHLDKAIARDIQENVDESSPLIFPDCPINQEPPEEHEALVFKKVVSSDAIFCNSMKQIRPSHTRNILISPMQVHRSSVLDHSKMSPECERRPLVSPTEDQETTSTSNTVTARKAIKRRQISEDTDVPTSSSEEMGEHTESLCTKVPSIQSISMTICPAGEGNDQVHNKKGRTESLNNIQCVDKNGTSPKTSEKLTDMNEILRKVDTGKSKECVKSPAKKRPQPCQSSFTAESNHCLDEDTSNNLATTGSVSKSRSDHNEVSTSDAHSQASVCKVREKVLIIELNTDKPRHYNGTNFQYKYKPPSPDLQARVNAIRFPTELYAWALKILSETEELVP